MPDLQRRVLFTTIPDLTRCAGKKKKRATLGCGDRVRYRLETPGQVQVQLQPGRPPPHSKKKRSIHSLLLIYLPEKKKNRQSTLYLASSPYKRDSGQSSFKEEEEEEEEEREKKKETFVEKYVSCEHYYSGLFTTTRPESL